MSDEREFQLPDEFAPAGSELRAFARDQMVACESCRRASPPTRMSCIYCGASLPATVESAALRRPTLRELETWEQGYNVVLLADENSADVHPSEAEVASFLGMEAGLFRELLRRGETLPLVRAASEEEARLITERLAAVGLRTEVVWDEVLSVESEPPRRVRRLEIDGERVLGRDANGASEALAWADVDLIAVGIIITRRTEAEERRGRVKRGGELADSREVFSDERALEVYAKGARAGWRIMAGGFDYSCLGRRMGLLAAENFNALVTEFRRRAPSALFDDRYDGLRHMLDAAWPPQERTTSSGLRRERPGKFNTEAATVASNDTQFTRYARLRRLLAAREG